MVARARSRSLVSLGSLAVLAFVAGCASTPPRVYPSGTKEVAPPPAPPPPLQSADKREVWKGPSGTIYEHPSLGIYEVIADSEGNGVKSEYEYLATLRCNGDGRWESNEQSLIEKDGRPLDVLHCVCTRGGEQRDFTFDITQFFGKH
jgi:hypothetical protein